MSSVDVLVASTLPGLRQRGRRAAGDLLLERHVLEHGFDDQIDVAEAVVADLRADSRHPLFDHRRREASALHRDVVVLADRGDASVERRLARYP